MYTTSYTSCKCVQLCALYMNSECKNIIVLLKNMKEHKNINHSLKVIIMTFCCSKLGFEDGFSY